MWYTQKLNKDTNNKKKIQITKPDKIKTYRERARTFRLCACRRRRRRLRVAATRVIPTSFRSMRRRRRSIKFCWCFVFSSSHHIWFWFLKVIFHKIAVCSIWSSSRRRNEQKKMLLIPQHSTWNGGSTCAYADRHRIVRLSPSVSHALSRSCVLRVYNLY